MVHVHVLSASFSHFHYLCLLDNSRTGELADIEFVNSTFGVIFVPNCASDICLSWVWRVDQSMNWPVCDLTDREMVCRRIVRLPLQSCVVLQCSREDNLERLLVSRSDVLLHGRRRRGESLDDTGLWSGNCDVNQSINRYFIVCPKVDHRAGQLCLLHIGIDKTEKIELKHKNQWASKSGEWSRAMRSVRQTETD